MNEWILFTIGILIGGMLGFDQAYKGNLVLAFFKTITLGGLFIWFILDIWTSAHTASTTMHLYKKYLRQEQGLKN